MSASAVEGIAYLDAAGGSCATSNLTTRNRPADGHDGRQAIGGRPRSGSSTWQSFARGDGTNEIDWLNGEIVLLGRLHGVPTPINTMLCELARWAAANGIEPRTLSADDLTSRLAG